MYLIRLFESNRIKIIFTLLAKFVTVYMWVAKVYLREQCFKKTFSRADILGLMFGIFLTLDKQFQDKFYNSLEIFISISTNWGATSRSRSGTWSGSTKKNYWGKKTAIVLDTNSWRRIDKPIVVVVDR